MDTNKTGPKPSRALFFGQTDDNSKAVYKLEDFHDTFVELQDITEYKAAVALVGSWPEWKRIKRGWGGFEAHIKEWISEIEVCLKSEAIAKIHDLSRSDTSQAFQAAKFLATKEYDRQSGAGRPTKAERERQAKIISRAASETEAEAGRVFSVVSGGKGN